MRYAIVDYAFNVSEWSEPKTPDGKTAEIIQVLKTHDGNEHTMWITALVRETES